MNYRIWGKEMLNINPRWLMHWVATLYVDRAGMLHEGSGHSIC